ncbi:heme peroxidase [Mycena galopus ATCC 62051]|nr:heme peroxidase [Mycena galopus ATCC 62051]
MLPLILLGNIRVVSAYIWPSPQLDALESLRFDLDRHTLGAFLEPCDKFSFGLTPFDTGRSNAADCIRTAYHDTVTYNLTDGTGGLDASIRFLAEFERPENNGTGFINTIGTVFLEANPYISMAGSLAIATILVIENCGGPEIPFRGGRLDAGEANAPGVPQPQQDLDDHTAAFAKMGFSPTEMIGLLACGHTFRGVETLVFRTIVLPFSGSNDTQSVAHFDSPFVTFDNNVCMAGGFMYTATRTHIYLGAKEYIAGTTQNLLVVGFNDTTNSDKRIFGSDGNVTMNSFAASPELFASTCVSLLGCMLETVPAGVQFTEVTTPLPVKPSSIQLVPSGNVLQFSGQLRVRIDSG